MPHTVQNLTIESLLEELSAHPVNANKFFVNFQECYLTRSQLHTFIRQYHFFCHRFVKVLEGLLYQTPLEELEMRVQLTKTLYSELGSGSLNHAHIRHLEQFSQAAGLAQEDLTHTEPIPEVRQYLEVLHNLFIESEYLQALGAELAVETTAVSEFRYFLPGLQKYPQFTPKDLTFFSMHLEEEITHSDWLATAVKKTTQTSDDLEQVALGARRTANAWHTFWNGMHRAIFDSCA
ncbi:MAG: TenA family transcriptional regulator [Nitrospirales bacterium]